MKVVVIGNGVSRHGFPLQKIPFYTIGCNALYRDFEPNLLVVADKNMQQEVLNSDYKGKLLLRRRGDVEYPSRPNMNFFEEKVASSGLKGIWYALTQLRSEKVYLLGFDFDIRPGNVYAGSQNYSSKPASAAANWRGEVARMAERTKRLVWIYDQKGSKNLEKFRITSKEFLTTIRMETVI